MYRRFSFVPALLLVTASVATAQTREVQRPPDGGAVQRIIGIFIPSMPNAPFTATVTTEWTRPLADGTTIAWKNHRIIARDTTGRIFQERRWFVAAAKQDEPGLMQIEISDPASHQLYICRPEPRVCDLRPFYAPAFEPSVPVSAAGRGSAASTIEDLGKQSIEGFEVTGQRETMVIESNAMGNNRPIMTKREFWYSPLLGVNLLSKREDPRFGTENFEVTHISVGEPDAKLFELPTGFRVVNMAKPSEVPAAATTAPPN